MRKKFLLQPIVWAAIVVLFSCQKETAKTKSNDQLLKKVYSWLDNQKSPSQPNKAANIDLLKQNLNFSALNFEDLNQNETFLVIPVNEQYETKKNIDRKTILVLLLVTDRSTNIIRGSLVLYSPEDNQGLNEIPRYTFFKMYNNKSLDCSGLFKFLSVTGRRMYQREYRDGKLRSFGYVKSSNQAEGISNQAEGRTETECTYFYYILTWWIDGIPVAQEAIYLGRICESACDDPNNQTLCPDSGGGGGGGGGLGTEETCCIPDPNAQISVTNGSESQWTCAGETTDPISGNPTKTCIHTWSFQHNHLLWYSWDFVSQTFAQFEKISGDWYFKSTPTFQGVTPSGQLPACVSSKCISVSARIPLDAHRRSGMLFLAYTIETKITCFQWSQPRYDPYTAEATLIPPA
jgi:hypothetical protein